MKIFKFKKNKKGPASNRRGMLRRGGFTLIETMIAITILVLAILGPLTIAANALHSAYFASDQVTAFYLAQEGIEYMRFLRDNEFIHQETVSDGTLWDDALAQCDEKRGGYNFCGLDANNIFSEGADVFINCNSIAECRIKQDSTGAFHQVDLSGDTALSGALTPTNFYRTIRVSQINPDEDQITVQVKWTTGNLSSPSNFEITENVFNWLGSGESSQITPGGGSDINPGGGGDITPIGGGGGSLEGAGSGGDDAKQ